MDSAHSVLLGVLDFNQVVVTWALVPSTFTSLQVCDGVSLAVRGSMWTLHHPQRRTSRNGSRQSTCSWCAPRHSRRQWCCSWKRARMATMAMDLIMGEVRQPPVPDVDQNMSRHKFGICWSTANSVLQSTERMNGFLALFSIIEEWILLP